MAPLSLRLFGGFALYTPRGAEIAVRLAKERALLAYLALHPGKKFTRSHLSGLLWSEQSEEKARHSLSQTLSSLHRALIPTVAGIQRGHSEIVLHEGKVDVDVTEFQSLARSDESKDWRRAVELYDDHLLVDFEFEEPEFEDWAYSLRAECEDQAMRIGLAYLSHSQEDDIRERISVALRLLRTNPIAEPVHQALIPLLSGINSGV